MGSRSSKKNGRNLNKKNVFNKTAAVALSATILTSVVPIRDLRVIAMENNVDGMEEVSKLDTESLQPTGNGYSIKTLIEWSAESDPNARYNRATVKLQDRFVGPVVNPNANPEARIMNCALTNPQSDNAPSQGGDTENAYVFSYWQYVDSYVYWGGTSKGIFLAPTPDVVDAAHKNGVPVLGTVGFPWGSGAGYVDQVREFLQKDENGKFIVADKMIEMARFYGFDGWFINQESYGCSKEDATLMVEFFTYIKETAPDIRIGWYDSMTTNGPVSYQDSLTPYNVGFFQNEGKRVTDDFFLNYNWTKSKVDTSVKTAQSVGRSQYDVYAGVEVQQNAYNDRFPVENLLDENGKIRLSLAMYCPNSTFSMAKDIDDFYMHDQKFWVGPTGDPAKSDTTQKWVGLANYVADRSAINTLPFVTNFNLGHGKSYYVDGDLSRDKEWNNRAAQDFLPTWRWIVESNGEKLTPSFDRDDAYNGGSSLKVEGKLEAQNPNHIKLYSTKLAVNDESTELSITYKTPLDKSNMKIGLCFGDNYDEENFEFIDISDGKPGEWNTVNIPLDQYIGKTINGISLKFESNENIEDYKMNVGNISITEKSNDTVLPASSKVTLDDSILHNARKAEAKIYWEDVEGADYYEIYRETPDGGKEYISSTYNNSLYISPFNRNGDEDSFNFEVVAVSKNFNRGEAAKLKFNWNIGANDTEVPEETTPVNLALNKPVKASSQNAGEPAYKAVDGTVDNNSKWCTTTGLYNSWLEIDLGQEETIERWVTMHGEAGGEAKETNTKEFRLQVLKDGKFVDVDTVKGNTEAVVDRNLTEPVTGRYFRLQIDNHGSSPWGAIRIYEFQLYKDKHIERSTNISLNDVMVTNNIGNNDTVIAKNVKVGNEISLYKDINDTEAFASKVAEKENEVIRFENLDLGENEGRIFYTIKQAGKEESIKLSASYESETWETVKIPNRFEVSHYEVKPRTFSLDFFGTIKIGDLQNGDVVRYYKNINDEFPTKVSMGAINNTATLEALNLNLLGGEVVFDVVRNGMRKTPKFKVIYNNELKASAMGIVEIDTLDNSEDTPVEGAIYEISKGNEVITSITTGKDGKASLDLEPGEYSLRYTGNLDNYEKDDTKYEYSIKSVFDVIKISNSLIRKVDKTLLGMVIEYAENAVAEGALENVVPAVVKEFENALKEAKDIFESDKATEVKVDLASKKLINAIHMLEFQKGDKSELIKLAEIINALEEGKYTPATWSALQDELKKANAVIADENAMEEEVAKAYENLNKAFTELELVADKSKLQGLVTEVEDKDMSKYTPGTVNNLNLELANAKAVLDNKEAKQEEVNSAYNKLIKAYLDLRLIPDKSILEDLIKKAEAMDLSKYTRASVERFNIELDNVKALLDNKEASEKEVEEAAKGLETALGNLEIAKDTSTGGNANNNSNNNNNGNNNNSDDKIIASNVASTTNGKGNSKLPSTGGVSSASVGLLGAITSLVGAVMMKRRKRN